MYKYNLTIRNTAPLHIGDGNIGYVNKTKSYIPSKNVWGSMVCSINEKYNIQDFYKIGDCLNKSDNIILPYFYVYDNNNILYPDYNGQLKYGNFTENEFKTKYVSSYINSGINPVTLNAIDGNLHEFEYIIKNNIFKGCLYLDNPEGILYIDDIKIELKKIFEDITIGGEQTYGFGQCELINISKPQPVNKIDIFFDERKLLRHLIVKKDFNKIFNGNVEILYTRIFDKHKGAGRKIENMGIALTPGTKLENINFDYQIGKYGFAYLN